MEIKRAVNGGSVSKRGARAKRGDGGNVPPVLGTNKDILDLIAKLKQNKVEHFKSDTLEIKFSMMAFLPDAPKSTNSKTETQEETDELLFYSSPERR